MIQELTAIASRLIHHFGRWRLAFLLFILAYAAILMLYLDYAPIRWDETPHLYGGLLLSRGQIQDYAQQYLFYPPLFDITTALNYIVFGAGVFASRLVALTFGILTVWVIFEYASRLYGPKTGLLSSLLLASMPGFIILSRMALIETMLMFFFSAALFLFYLWTQTKKTTLLLLSGVALGLGFIAKYQVLVAGLVMLLSLVFLVRERVQVKVGKFLLLAVVVVAIIAPWFLLVYQQSIEETLGDWFYAVQVGNEERTAYSRRFPLPLFYLIEVTYPYEHIHPISLPLYTLSLLGLAVMLWRRKREDIYSLTWFITVYVFFTLIPNKEWRYVTPAFPILAVSAAIFILLAWNKMKQTLEAAKTNSSSKRYLQKFAAAVFVLLLAISFVYSWSNAYSWAEFDHVYIPTREASQYVVDNSSPNQSTVVLFTDNYFSTDMVKFYLSLLDPNEREIWPYPERAADAYKPELNETFLISRCEAANVKFLLLYEHGDITYFDSEWKSYYVFDRLINSGRFVFDRLFGEYPRRVIVLQFVKES